MAADTYKWISGPGLLDGTYLDTSGTTISLHHVIKPEIKTLALKSNFINVL